MGGGSSTAHKAAPEPIPTTVTLHSTVHTSTADSKASEVKCWIHNHEILCLSLAFISGVLVTVLGFVIIYLFRKKCKRSCQRLQEQVPSQTVTEESSDNTQNEVSYSTLVFQQSRTPAAV